MPWPLAIMAVAAEEMRVFSGREGVVDWAGPHLGPNLPLLSQEQIEIARMLIEERQGHLFSGWPGLGVADSDKRKFFCQSMS